MEDTAFSDDIEFLNGRHYQLFSTIRRTSSEAVFGTKTEISSGKELEEDEYFVSRNKN